MTINHQPIPMATRIGRLITLQHPDRPLPDVYREVAAEASHAAGHEVDAETVESLHTGQTLTAPRPVLTALAVAFQVQPSYLLDDDCHSLDQQLELLAMFRQTEWLSLRGDGELSVQQRQRLLEALREQQAGDGPSPTAP